MSLSTKPSQTRIGAYRMKLRQTSRRRSTLARRLSWLVAAGLATAALITPSAAFAAGPGNNGLDATGNGTKSNATVGGSLADAGNSAVMDGSQGGSTLTCDGDSAGKSTG